MEDSAVHFKLEERERFLFRYAMSIRLMFYIGYTIPLDKRLANDGTGLQDVTINDKSDDSSVDE